MMASWPIFMAFFRIGLYGFGGGPAMLPLMQAECVDTGFLTEEVFMEGLAISSTLPGPISTKMALWIGYHHSGYLGAMMAFVGVLTPSSVLMVVIGAILLRFRENPYVHGALDGVKPAVVGMLFFVAVDLAQRGVVGLSSGAIALLAFAALAGRVHPGLVILGAAVVGATMGR